MFIQTKTNPTPFAWHGSCPFKTFLLTFTLRCTASTLVYIFNISPSLPEMCNCQNPLEYNSSNISADFKRHHCECELLLFLILQSWRVHISYILMWQQQNQSDYFLLGPVCPTPAWQEPCQGLVRHSMLSGQRSGSSSHYFHNT